MSDYQYYFCNIKYYPIDFRIAMVPKWQSIDVIAENLWAAFQIILDLKDSGCWFPIALFPSNVALIKFGVDLSDRQKLEFRTITQDDDIVGFLFRFPR